MERTALIVGGGIGGLATARGLARNGWTVQVLEQAPAFAPLGAGIGLAPNAVRGLDWLGVGGQLRAHGMAHGPAGVRRASGRWLLRTDFADLKDRFGEPFFARHRASLHELLVESVPAKGVRTGHAVTSVHQDGPQATVGYETADGPGEESADLVVAADGVHSRLRACCSPIVPCACLHRLRHSVATFLVNRGEILAAQARLGHSDAATTLRIYAHPLPHSDTNIADTINHQLDTLPTNDVPDPITHSTNSN